jgi:hypothetical protein
MDDYSYTTLGADGWLRCDAFRPCSGTCSTILVTQGHPCNVAARTVSSGVDVVRFTWTSWFMLLTRA